MNKPFHELIEETRRVAKGVGDTELNRLNTALGYWAPEVKEQCFWYGHRSVWGYLDILEQYFQDHEEVLYIYNDFMDTFYYGVLETRQTSRT